MKKIYDYMPYVVLFSVIIIDFIIFYALMVTLKVLEKEIVAAIIGFIGSVLGGVITLVGVQWTLKHRDREIFLTSVTERLIAVDHLINELKSHIDRAFSYHYSIMNENKYDNIRQVANLFYETLNGSKEIVYKYLEYDEVEYIDYNLKTLVPLLIKDPINDQISEEDSNECIQKMNAIYLVLTNSKNNLKERYDRYKKKA